MPILLFLFMSKSILADVNFDYYTLTIDDGLPSETVWVTLQDSLGYLWLGTGNGLCRYDGKSIEVFKTKDGLKGNSVVSLALDNHGNIIAGCYNKGISKIKYTKEGNLVFEKFEPNFFLKWDVELQDSISFYFEGRSIVQTNVYNKREIKKEVGFSTPRIRRLDKSNFLLLKENKLFIFDKDLNFSKEKYLKQEFLNLRLHDDSIFLLNNKMLLKMPKADLSKSQVVTDNLNLAGEVSSLYKKQKEKVWFLRTKIQ